MPRKRGKAEPRKDAPPAKAAAAFHAPFQDLAGLVKKAKKARPTAGPTPAPPAPPNDAHLLGQALAGVRRLEAAPRVQRRPHAGDRGVAADEHRRDLEAMARGEGFDVSYEDRFVRGRAAGVSRETLARLERGGFSISAHLDLHGLTLEDARRAVDEFLAFQQKQGRRCVLVVTGKGKNSLRGDGVLREQVPEWLARGPSARRVLAFASARPCDGGLGALVVLMRGTSSSKHRIDVEHGGGGPLFPGSR